MFSQQDAKSRATNGLVGAISLCSHLAIHLLKYFVASEGNNVRPFSLKGARVPCNKFSIPLLFIAINRFKLILCYSSHSIKEWFALKLLSRLFCSLLHHQDVSKDLEVSCYKPIFITLQGYIVRNLSL